MTKGFVYCLVCLVSFIISEQGYSQSKYRLSGKVVDAESNSPLAAVTVSSSTGNAVNTDAEGNFFITLEANNNYTLTFSSVGFSEKQLTDIHFDGKDIPVLTVQMNRADKALEAVVVKADVRREAQTSLYNIQRTSSSISDGISAELIRRSPDKTTGDVLKRVSGASVQDNKFVVIRGLSERYNASLLNNSVLPSTESDKRAFAFDIIPSSLVDNLVIYKSSTPDLPGDFSGGAIKVSTKDYPSKKISDLSLSIGYNSLTTGKNFYKSFPNGDYDAAGFLDDSRLMPGSYYHNRYGFISQNDKYKATVTKLFPNTYGYEAAVKSAPSVSVGYTGGNTSVFKNGNKLGILYSAAYGIGRANNVRERTEYEVTKRLLYDYPADNYDEKTNLSALLNLTYSYGKSKISFKNLFNNSFVKTTGLRNGSNYENEDSHVFYIKSANSEVTQQGLLNSVLEGLHKLNTNWTLDWNASYAVTYKNQPDQRILTFRTRENTTDQYFIKLNNENSPEIRNAGRVYSFLTENIYGASANVARQFKLFGQVQKLKFGSMNYYRDREVEVDALGYATLSSLAPGGVTINETKSTTFNNIFTNENIDQYHLVVANIETNSAQYTGNALLNTGYAMFDNKFSPKIKLTWGARVEKYRQELSARNKATKVYDNTDVLPSFLFTYSPNDRSNIRLAGSQAVNRPEFRELADYGIFDYDNYVVIRGNPDLQRCLNNNADIRYEWFPAAGEIVSASLFFKHFDKPIEQVNKGNDVLSYENADEAKAYGAEIELRKKLGFISPGILNNITFYANAAYIKGSVQFNGLNFNSPLQGQSPYLINTGLNYSAPGDVFSINVLYNRIGPRLKFRAQNGAALNIFERPRDVMDVQVTKKLFKNRIEARLTIADIFAQPFTWYYKYDVDPSNTNYKAADDKIINSIKYGSTATLSLRYSFGK